jgi:ATP-dependent RNA helicase SUPV3L1/SUV3
LTLAPSQSGQTVTAVLGPTNTGKTYLAMDRMLGHATGMIGFPLRLLARENYERAVAIKGKAAVALVTGEEKIIPPGARYFLCTVESMPVDREVAFFGVDEIQLAADRDRGHVFTDRLLNGRGGVETMFLGAETIRPLIRQLVPGVKFLTRPRFSKLTYSGPKKLTRLPHRAAVVAFSVSEVYGIADLLRRQRGGTAVVMGALSPRARNAQVALYQSGEVDYLVATDAIGMGLNMDVDHVAFASLTKFDGRSPRRLSASELSQIAGRAGRHMNDGTFGVTADAPSLDPEIVARIESHEFPPLKTISWRNKDLTFATVRSLLAGLQKSPTQPGLVRPPPADDQTVLEILFKDADIQGRAKGTDRVRLLWDVAQVPDFRKLKPETHARLLSQVYLHLTDARERLPEDWVADQVKRLDRNDGDIHVLMDRIAAIRIWTYLANRPGWIKNARDWQDQTRAVEDRLSDALHEKLTTQFIDRRTVHLVKKLKGDERLIASVDDDGRVGVDGHFIGHMEGLTFKPDRTGLKTADRAVVNAANAALVPELSKRVLAQLDAEDDVFSLDDDARILWQDAAVATLVPGSQILKPSVEVKADDRLNPAQRERLKARYQAWVNTHIASVLAPLVKAEGAPLSGAARGLSFQIVESLGTVKRKTVEAQIKALSEDDQKALARIGIRFGLNSLYVPDVLKANPIRLRALLWIVSNKAKSAPPLPPAGRVSFDTSAGVPADYYFACGFQPVRGTAYRVDMVERFAADVRRLLREKAVLLPPAYLSPLGIGAEKAAGLITALGYSASITEDGLAIASKQKPSKQKPPKRKGKPTPHPRKKKAVQPYDPGSPFAKLKDLVLP